MAKFPSIGGYRNVINNSNKVLLTELYIEVFAQAVDYYCLYHIDHRKGLNKPMEGKYDHQIKQNNGKENMFKHIFQGYILPKDKQSKISMTGYKVENHLGKGGGIS